jgi:hypothetical protein
MLMLRRLDSCAAVDAPQDAALFCLRNRQGGTRSPRQIVWPTIPAENDPEHHTYKIHSSVAGLVLTAVRPGIRPLVHFAAFHDEINLLQ